MNISDSLWDRVRGWFFYPPIAPPKVIPDMDGGAAFDFKDGEIVIGEDIVKRIKKTGVKEETALEGILTHEIGHYIVFPRDLATIIFASKIINDFFPENKRLQQLMFQTYADVADDLESVLHSKKKDSVLALRDALQTIIEHPADQQLRGLMLSYLHFHAEGKAPKLDAKSTHLYKKMREINFAEHADIRVQLFQWGSIVNEIMKEYPMEPNTYIFGEDIPAGAIIREASPQEIDGALRKLIGRVSKSEYDQIKKWLSENGVDCQDQGPVTIGVGGGELTIDPSLIDYYTKLSQNYPMAANKKVMPTETRQKTFEGVEKWRIQSEPLLALPHLSGGKFLPSITRKLQIKEKPVKTIDYDLPHLLIAIDTSGSMPDPKHQISDAVLGGVCAARSYHHHGSAIGVINFSGKSFYLPYTRDLRAALGAIVAYQGGGTELDTELLEKMLGPQRFERYKDDPERAIIEHPALRKAVTKDIKLSALPVSDKSIDLIMFTDGGIANLDDVLKRFQARGALNRATIVLTAHYDQTITKTKGINVYRVKDPKDIAKVIIHDVNNAIQGE